MKWICKLCSIATLCLVFISGNIAVSSGATVDISVSAVITSSITATTTTDLDFGSIDLDPAGDVITIDADATGTATVSPVATNSSVVTGGTNGVITIASAGGFAVAVVVPVNLTLDDGSGNTIDLTSIDASSQYGSAGDSSGSATKTGGVDLSIRVGGILTVPASTPAGTYTGTLTVTLNYS